MLKTSRERHLHLQIMLVLPRHLPLPHHPPQNPPNSHVLDYLAERSQKYESPRELSCQSKRNLVMLEGGGEGGRFRQNRGSGASSMCDNQSIQSSRSLMRKAMSILGSISLRCILRRRRVWQDSISARVYNSKSSWRGRAVRG